MYVLSTTTISGFLCFLCVTFAADLPEAPNEYTHGKNALVWRREENNRLRIALNNNNDNNDNNDNIIILSSPKDAVDMVSEGECVAIVVGAMWDGHFKHSLPVLQTLAASFSKNNLGSGDATVGRAVGILLYSGASEGDTALPLSLFRAGTQGSYSVTIFSKGVNKGELDVRRGVEMAKNVVDMCAAENVDVDIAVAEL
jgi:hypothetical protein